MNHHWLVAAVQWTSRILHFDLFFTKIKSYRFGTTWELANNKSNYILVQFCLFLVPLVTSLPATITLERPPSILVPLKVHSPPQGYQLYMTCAVRGFPTPHVTWYLNGNCINTNNTYYITNTYGVCSMYIIRVGPEHSGEYRVVAVNSFGRAECSTKLRVKGMLHVIFISTFDMLLQLWSAIINYILFWLHSFRFIHRLKFRVLTTS